MQIIDQVSIGTKVPSTISLPITNGNRRSYFKKKIPKNSHKKNTESTAELQIAIMCFSFFKTNNEAVACL